MGIEKIVKYMTMPNVAVEIDEDELNKIGQRVVDGYDDDKATRAEWEQRTEAARKLARQVKEPKSFPWPDAANVKYPLLTTAAIQFNARAYAAIIQGKSVAKALVFGEDPDGAKFDRATRVSKHLNWQLMEGMPEWEPDMDRLLITQPIVGCVFKKTFQDQLLDRPKSPMVQAENLVADVNAKDENTARMTEEIELMPNEVVERQNMDIFLDVDGIPERDGRDDEEPNLFLEQHWWFDLDDDGYKEPYVVTVHHKTKKVVRIVARYDAEGIVLKNVGLTFPDGLMVRTFADLRAYAMMAMQAELAMSAGQDPGPAKEMIGQPIPETSKLKLARIEPVSYYTKYDFLPDPNGGFYGLGLGQLLEPINETVNSLLNQIIDAGTLANTQGGFIASGVRIKRGDTNFKMGEFKTVTVSGGTARDNIIPLPFNGPSAVLFTVLSFMVEAGRDISSIKDIMMGDLPQGDVPATTTLAAIEQVQKLFTGIYKRIHRALKSELKKIYRLNKTHLRDEEYFRVVDSPELVKIGRSDYAGDDTDISPISDPTIASETQRLIRAQSLMGFIGDPFFNQYDLRRRYLEALEIPNIDVALLKEPAQPPPDPKQIMAEVQAAKAQADFMLRMMELEMKYMEAWSGSIKNLAQAEGVEIGQQLEMYGKKLEGYKLSIEEMKARQTGQQGATNAQQGQDPPQQGGLGGLEGPAGGPGLLQLPGGPGGAGGPPPERSFPPRPSDVTG